jgi:hypothetical protein
VFWLTLIPFATLLYGFTLTSFYGPTAAPDPDPAYYYVLNALNLLEGHPIAYIEQPGTPVQIVGAIAFRTVYALQGSGGVAHDLIDDPAVYVVTFFRFLVLLYVVALTVLGYVVWRQTGRVEMAVISQGLPHLLGNCSRLVPITSECLLVSVVALLLLLVVQEVGDGLRSPLRAPLYGGVVGLGIAVKLTFAPLAFVPLALMRTVKDVVSFALAVTISFAICTAPIWSEYPRLISWVVVLALKQGSYGKGPEGPAQLSSWLANFADVVVGEAVLAALMVAAGVSLLARRQTWKRRAMSSIDRLLVGLVLAGAAQFALTALIPGSHYFTPMRGTSGVLLWLVLETSPPLARWATGNRLLAVGVLAVGATLLTLPFSLRSDDAEIQKRLSANYERWAKVFSAGSTSVAYSLWIGNWFSGYCHADLLSARYPDVYVFNGWTGSLSDWRGNQLELTDLRNGHAGVVLVGPRRLGARFALPWGGDTWRPPPGALHDTFMGEHEAIYEISN